MERITNEEINRNIKKEEYRQFLLRITEGHPSHEVLKKLYSHDELKKVSESDKNFFFKERYLIYSSIFSKRNKLKEISSFWHSETTAPENKELLVLLDLKKQNRICYAFAKKISGFWFIKKNLEDINIPCLSDYEILKWASLPENPFCN